MTKSVQPKTQRELLAFDIANALGDADHLGLYLTYCKKYAVHILERAYGEARSIPAERIKKTRAALFFYLVKRYSHEQNSTRHKQTNHNSLH
jgi:hypothetical protein